MPKTNGSTVPLTNDYKLQQMRPIVTEYIPKTNGVKTERVMVKYKCDGSDSLKLEAGSTIPLVEPPFCELEPDEPYNPFEHRNVMHPTSNFATFTHLLKGSLGSGILSMPMAVRNAGSIVGFIGTFIIGAICTYCVHILVKSAQELCRRRRVPSLGFAETAEAAFLSGSPTVRKYSRLAKALINVFLVIDLLGCCIVYIGFAAKNLKQVIDIYTVEHLDEKLYMAMFLPVLIPINMIRNLKYLAPFSTVANTMIGSGIFITFYYLIIQIINEAPRLSTRPFVAEWHQLPMFFGTAIFALEGIGVVMPLENNMQNPHQFLGCPGVLNSGMSIVVALYAVTGILGFMAYGNDTLESITLNLPSGEDHIAAQIVKLMIAVAIFLTYSLQFYVPMEIIWNNVKYKFRKYSNAIEFALRGFLVFMTVVIAIAIPNIGPFISLIGAVCLSTLGLIFPALIELITFWDRNSRFNWLLVRNSFLIAFGVIGFIAGTLVSIHEMGSHAPIPIENFLSNSTINQV